MSAILPNYNQPGALGALGADGVRRYKTRCKVLVDSHNSGSPKGNTETVVLTDDVFAVSMGKTIKGAGTATLSLTPSQNYLNLVFPNDYINVYFDIGDGSGWTRTFFGYIDRVEETYKVNKDGKPSTLYRLVCTDFYKAFDKTIVYFNPQMNGREDFEEYDFAAPNVGGLALQSRGVVFGGAPSDIVENVILTMLGFGTQFRLPPSYVPKETQTRLRKFRVEGVRGRLPPEAQARFDKAGGNIEKMRRDAKVKATNTVDTAFEESNDLEEMVVRLQGSYGLDNDSLDGKSKEDLVKLFTDLDLQSIFAQDGTDGVSASAEGQSTREQNILASASSENSALIDLVDTFTFIERRAMDGYIMAEPVWEQQGSLISILKGFSNESVNELFLDLRALNADTSGRSFTDDLVQGKYATLPDDKQGNVNDKDGAPNGITYIPAVVMREYPFSTINELDLTNAELSLQDDEQQPEKIGLLYFGDIFNQGPNVPGRRVVTGPNINLADTKGGKSTGISQKHLDVAVIEETEIVSTSLGRSDNDHFNLFEFISDSLLGTDMRFYMKDFLPIINPIHISRNGLRVRSISTKAARFGVGQLINLREGTPDNTGEDVTDETLNVVQKGDIDPPTKDGSTAGYSASQPLSNWNYRLKKPGTSAGRPNADPPIPEDPTQWYWKYHTGIDITRKPSTLGGKRNRLGGTAVPIYAIADGWIVISAPDKCYDGYGNVIVIKHNFEGVSGLRYSVYAHLSKRVKGWGVNVPTGNRSGVVRARFASKDMTGIGAPGKHQPKKVSKGDIIGYMGHSGTTTSTDHLHFEICRHFPPYKGMRDGGGAEDSGYTPAVDVVSSPPGPAPVIKSLDLTPDEFTNAKSGKDMPRYFNSCDPNLFYSVIHGKDLASEINGAEPPDETDDAASDPEDEIDIPDPQDDNPSKEVEEVEDPIEEAAKATEKSVTRDSVDTASSRKQISRWALLQDHWYQHNLEYLSGRVDMRGAPEIRVGYRLDITDRNMSFYVEGVNHDWQFPNNMNTSLQVTRGQPNRPFPIYVLPAWKQMGATEKQRRTSDSRLATFFITPDPVAIRRSLFIKPGGRDFDPGSMSGLEVSGHTGRNEVDYIPADGWKGIVATKYNEAVIPAGATNKVDDPAPEPDNDPTDTASNTRLTGNPPRTFSKDDPVRLRNKKGGRRR